MLYTIYQKKPIMSIFCWQKEYQGQGIAEKLVENVMENAKRLNKSIEATCSYAKKVIEKNKSEVD